MELQGHEGYRHPVSLWGLPQFVFSPLQLSPSSVSLQTPMSVPSEPGPELGHVCGELCMHRTSLSLPPGGVYSSSSTFKTFL